MSSVPIAVLSTPTAKAHASMLDKIKAPINDIKDTVSDMKDTVVDTKDKINNIIETVDKIINWFKNIKTNISEMSIDLMVWSYNLITSVVLHTPVFLFDSEWFKANTVTFTGLSIVMSMLILIYEGFQKMFSGFLKSDRTTDMSRVAKRVPLVVIGSALAPSAFYYGFKGLNYVTDMITNISKASMANGIDKLNFNDVTMLELVAFIGFDLAIIGMMIPIFLQNFRRWADLLMLGVMTPMALSCWMFEAHEHIFKSWWSTIKKASMVQLTYAVFLLIIGTLMFGTKIPNNPTELFIKMGVIIGCFWRMNTPPSIVRSGMDSGVDIGKIWDDAGKSLSPQGKHKFIGKGLKAIKNRIPFMKKGDK